MRRDRSRVPVLYIAPWVSVGGSDTGTIDWFRRLDRDRFAPSLITTQPSPNLRLDEVTPYADEVWALPELMPGAAFPSFILGFIAGRGIQVVHIMNSRLGFDLLADIRSLANRPATVVQLHVEEPDRSGYVRYVTTRYGTLVDAFSVTSHHLADAVRGYGIPESRCRVIPTGVDAEQAFNPDRVDPLPRPGDGAAEILFCGRLVEQKDPLLMVQVAAALRDRGAAFRIHCVGDGHLEPQVRAAIAAEHLEDRVLLHGASGATARWYRTSDLVLMTSLYEGVPYVAYEAMAMAVPVVAPALPGNVELMAGVGGTLVEDRTDVAAYVDALSALLGDPPERRRLGLEGRRRVRESFSLAAMGSAHGNLYSELLAPPPAVASPARPSRAALAPIRLARRPSEGVPLVSVIVPCYEHGSCLDECLDSIREQTHPRVEIIVVDDGSRDPETLAVLARLADDPAMTLLRLASNSGPSAARNAGIAAATGRYILPVDADNLLTPAAIELLVGQLQRAGEAIGFIYPNREYFGDNSEYVHAPGYNLHTLLGVNFCDTCSLIDGDVFAAGVRYAEDMILGHEDWDLVLQLASRGVHGEPAEGPTVRVRRRGFSRSDLVARAELDTAQVMRARHPSLYAREDEIKARWSPGLSFIALDPVPQDEPATAGLTAGIAGQTLGDAEVILRRPGYPVDAGGPRVRHLNPAAVRSRAEAAREGLNRARGRVVCLHEGHGAALSHDRALLEKLIRIVETVGEAVALADARHPGIGGLQRLGAEPAGLRPHTVLWPRAAALLLPEVELSSAHPVSDVVAALGGHVAVHWHHLPAPDGGIDHDSGPGASARLGHPGRRPSEEIEQWARLRQAPRLPGSRSSAPWLPPRTDPISRCYQPQTGERRVSIGGPPPEGFVVEHTLGAIQRGGPAGTVGLVATAAPSYRALEAGEAPGPGDRLLGHLEGSPLPLLDLIQVAALPGGEHTLIAGPDDPLEGIATPLLRLGWIEPLPLRPRELRAGPERRLIEALERREAELRVLRSRADAGAESPPTPRHRWAAGLAGGARRALRRIPGVGRAAAALRRR